MSVSILLAMLWLPGCGEEPRLEGVVLDVWDNPVEGATVVMEGQAERPLTDKNGKFSFPVVAGTHAIKAGREGYIQEHQTIEVAEGSEALPKPVFRLYRKPEEAGFYLVGIEDYLRLEPQPLAQVGGELESIRGVKAVGDVETSASDVRILFHTPLKLDQVMRLGLELHQLEYVHETEMAGPLAMTRVPVNLWRSAREIDFELEPMRSRTDYLITAAEMPPGAYAFVTQGMLDLTGDIETFQQIPDPLRVAYPLELR
jgi:hypothetical protein